MRIVAGKYRHRLIKWPEDNINIRPTKDRIREAIFSAVGDINNFNVLDLYAGSGAMGIEALSRGAKNTTFVDINPIAYKTIKENLKELQIDNAKIIFDCDFNALNILGNEHDIFDLIILDPPYQKGQYKEIIQTILNKSLLNDNGLIVIERTNELDISFMQYKKLKTYKYGNIFVDIIWY